ncbi:hypothetical protein CB1_001577023 [Camelus ferus]|nr:hypothetical protein CB1_001577023 [Camelus ferus]
MVPAERPLLHVDVLLGTQQALPATSGPGSKCHEQQVVGALRHGVDFLCLNLTPGEGAERPTAESGGTQPFRIPSLYSSELWSPRPVEIPASQPEGKTQPPTTLNTPASPRNDTNGLPVMEHGRRKSGTQEGIISLHKILIFIVIKRHLVKSHRHIQRTSSRVS